MSYVSLSYVQLALAASLILVNGLLSYLLRLGLGRQLILAAFRMIVQLLLIGQVLRWVFGHASAMIVVGLMLIMWLAASVAAIQRTERRYQGIWLDGLASIGAGAWSMLAFALAAVVRPTPWYMPQYAVPLLGMILGNTLSGVSLALNRYADYVVDGRDRIETLLALGATRWEAAEEAVRKAVRNGMIPTLNSMVVAGLVSLPGMMTGQLLSGIDPLLAVKYQIVILFLIATGTSIGTVAVVLLGYRRLFSRAHQLELWRLG